MKRDVWYEVRTCAGLPASRGALLGARVVGYKEQYEDEDAPIYIHPPQAMMGGMEDDGP
jgi:hypothetical protein